MTFHSRSVRTLLTLIVATIAFSVSASAITINFNDLTGPTNFEDAGAPQTLHYNTSAGDVTFSGGVILTETNGLPINDTSIYATASGFDPGFDNLLTIFFERPVLNFSMDVGNGGVDTIDYQVWDNLGQTVNLTLAPNAQVGAVPSDNQVQRVSFTNPGTIIQIRMTTTDINYFVFFIDNLEFESAPNPDPVPEPSSLWMLGSGLSACALFIKRSRKI